MPQVVVRRRVSWTQPGLTLGRHISFEAIAMGFSGGGESTRQMSGSGDGSRWWSDVDA